MNKILYIIFISFIVSNCSFKPVVKHHGVPFLEKKQSQLVVNKSNKNDIKKILGNPSTTSKFDNDLWIYIENRKSKSSLFKLGKEIVLANNVLVLEIDKKGILKNKKFSVSHINNLTSFEKFFKNVDFKNLKKVNENDYKNDSKKLFMKLKKITELEKFEKFKKLTFQQIINF